jgi:hypothetical protein
MHVLPIVDELALFSVQDRGLPNTERINLRVLGRVKLAEFILCLGAEAPGGGFFLLKDHMFWFGDEGWLEPPYWVIIYTGPGERRMTHTNSDVPALVLHWGRDRTLLGNPSLHPVLLRLGGIATESLSKKPVLNPPQGLPQETSALLSELIKQLGGPKK